VSRRLSACRSIGGDGLNLPSPHMLRLREKLHVMLYRHIQDDRVAPSVVDVRLLRGLCLALCSAGSHPRRESTQQSLGTWGGTEVRAGDRRRARTLRIQRIEGGTQRQGSSGGTTLACLQTHTPSLGSG